MKVAGLVRRQLSTSGLARRRFSTSAPIPVIRLPAILFPSDPLTLAVREEDLDARPGLRLTPPRVREMRSMGAAAFAEGATTGVSLRLLESQGADADVLEVVGGERLRLVQVEGRTAAGCRLAAVAPFEDEPLDADDLGNSSAGGGGARRDAGGRMSLCTLDDETDCWASPPHEHPAWRTAAAPPEDASALSLWLAARLPLTSALRLHLLDCACPLKRMRDVVDAMQLIAGTSRAGDRYNARRGAMPLVLEYDTAEASGREPRRRGRLSRGRGRAKRLAGDSVVETS